MSTAQGLKKATGNFTKQLAKLLCRFSKEDLNLRLVCIHLASRSHDSETAESQGREDKANHAMLTFLSIPA